MSEHRDVLFRFGCAIQFINGTICYVLSLINYLGLAFILVGTVALWLDLGNRLFGSYVRSLWRTGWRVALITTCCAAMLIPLLARYAMIDAAWVVITYWVTAAAGALFIVLYLYPFRFGIQPCRPHGDVSDVQLIDNVIRLRRAKLTISDVPASLRVLLLTDIHCNDQATLDVLSKAVPTDCERPYDFAVTLGDFGENKELLESAVSLIAKVPTAHGHFALLGNHDMEGGREPLLTELLAVHGFKLLRNEMANPMPGIQLLATDWPFVADKLPEGTSGQFTIGLSHSPDALPRFSRAGVDIAFAGHTHGGGLHLPQLGPLLVPSRLGRVFSEGFYKHGDCKMYLSRGIGYYPGRHGRIGEILELELISSLKD